ncbi:MAG: hypothetical protein WD042_08240 [Phycisphaeraceae bacterium]
MTSTFGRWGRRVKCCTQVLGAALLLTTICLPALGQYDPDMIRKLAELRDKQNQKQQDQAENQPKTAKAGGNSGGNSGGDLDNLPAFPKEYRQGLVKARQLLAANDPAKARQAFTALSELRQRLLPARYPEIDVPLGRLALDENRPNIAEPYVALYTADRAVYRPRLFDAYILAGDIALARSDSQAALAIFDWLVKQEEKQVQDDNASGGRPGVAIAAEGAARAFASIPDLDQAEYAYKFAQDYANAKLADYKKEYDWLFKRLRDGLGRVRRANAIRKYGEDFVLFRDAETLRREKHNPKQAREIYQQIIKKYDAPAPAPGRGEEAKPPLPRGEGGRGSARPGEGTAGQPNASRSTTNPPPPSIAKPSEAEQSIPLNPYVDAARLYAALCLIDLAKAPKYAEIQQAEQELQAYLSWAKTPSGGLYEGDALLALGTIALEYRLHPALAEKHFAALDDWITRVRKEAADANLPIFNLETALANVRELARPLVIPPKNEWKKPDFWGNVKKEPIRPGELLNYQACPWYLNDIEEQCASYRGFFAFLRDDKDTALRHYRRLLSLDDTAVEGPICSSTNAFNRLRVSVMQGYLLGEPDDITGLNSQLRLPTLLADFHYLRGDFARAYGLYGRVARGDFGKLPPTQAAYLTFAAALALDRGQLSGPRESRRKAMAALQQVQSGAGRPDLKVRACYIEAHLLLYSSDPANRDRASVMMRQIAASNVQHVVVYRAKLFVSTELYAKHDNTTADHILATLAQAPEPYPQLAAYLRSTHSLGSPSLQPVPHKE